MDDKRTQDAELSKLMDAVRPASDDLAQPEFAPLAARSRRDPRVREALQRSQKLDLAIGDAMQDLPVPAGSVERLLAALEVAAGAATEQDFTVAGASGPGLAGPDATKASSPIVKPKVADAGSGRDIRKTSVDAVDREAQGSSEDATSPPSSEWRLRAPAGAGLLAATMLVVFVAWWALRPSVGEYGPNEILNSDWLFAVDESAAQQTSLDERQPPARYPMAKAVAMRPNAWRRIADFLGRSGVAYQLRSAAAARATLYVIDAEAGHDAPQVAQLPAAPNVEPWTTAGKAMSVWREGKLIYVLVVAGGEAEYKSFVTQVRQLAYAR